MEPVVREGIAQRLERLGALDSVALPLQSAVRKLIPSGSRAKELLSGTWLGHPVHPPLTDVVVGCWTSALILDRTDADRAADLLVLLGAGAAAPTALSGLADWAELPADTRRIGTVHALGNTTALALHVLSLVQRRRGCRGRGRALSALGMGVAMASAWLGGHLSFGRGVGVNQTVFESLPDDWTEIAGDAELTDGGLVSGTAAGVGVLVAMTDGRVSALLDRCSHRGCSLHQGTVEGDVIVCPCHGSAFRLADGSVVRGPATAPQPRLEVRRRDGRLEVRAPSGDGG